MIKHKHKGFTIVELVVVIVMISILVTVATIAYRTTQRNARDEKRKTDVAMLRGALSEYRADKGEYPLATTCTTSPSGSSQCWRNEVWTILKDGGYLEEIPQPETKAHSSHTSFNVASGGNANYGYMFSSSTSYGLYVPMENGACKTGKSVNNSWWNGVSITPLCNF